MLDYEKYIKTIAKSLETIASVLSEENKREKEEMKKDKEEMEGAINEILEYIDKNPEATKEEITSSLSE